jgi:hypothetical protein
VDFSDIDLSTLTKAEQLRLYDLIQEYKRREKDRRPPYVPNSGQQSVHQSEKPVRWVFAGNGSGKTALLANEAKWKLDGYNPIRKKLSKSPSRTIVVLDSPSKVADVWLPELQKWMTLKPEHLDKRGKPYVSRIIRPNGAELLFMFHDQDPMLFESIEADYVIFDEPPPEKIFISLIRGLRKEGSQPEVLVGGTPITSPWLRKKIWEPWSRGESPDTDCFKFASDVNKDNVNWEFVQKNIFSKYSEKELRIRRYGDWFDLEGLALAHLFDREIHVTALPPGWKDTNPAVIAIDPHPRKNHTAILLGVTADDRLYVIKELTSKSIPSEFAREIRNWYKGYRVIDIVCDSLGSTPMSGGIGNRSFIEVLNDNGVRCRATTFDEKKDEAWIAKIQEVLAVPIDDDRFGQRIPRLRIHPSCKGLIADIESVEWTKYRNIDEFKPKLSIESKDFLSCLKYALAAEPHFKRGREQVIGSSRVKGWNNNEKWRRRTSG